MFYVACWQQRNCEIQAGATIRRQWNMIFRTIPIAEFLAKTTQLKNNNVRKMQAADKMQMTTIQNKIIKQHHPVIMLKIEWQWESKTKCNTLKSFQIRKDLVTESVVWGWFKILSSPWWCCNNHKGSRPVRKVQFFLTLFKPMFKNYVVNLVCSAGHLTTWNSPHEIHHMMFKRRGEGGGQRLFEQC